MSRVSRLSDSEPLPGISLQDDVEAVNKLLDVFDLPQAAEDDNFAQSDPEGPLPGPSSEDVTVQVVPATMEGGIVLTLREQAIVDKFRHRLGDVQLLNLAAAAKRGVMPITDYRTDTGVTPGPGTVYHSPRFMTLHRALTPAEMEYNPYGTVNLVAEFERQDAEAANLSLLSVALNALLSAAMSITGMLCVAPDLDDSA
ncbi:hypothetical protein BKA70DRAFT_1222232 [Coprinopsis sp. MPI-PUGE-AT-0042]|nr:hypothetical protein BKA70DRAFT_1222232 [Coprinopsis sp. MPI-PUGE-AT-0042]